MPHVKTSRMDRQTVVRRRIGRVAVGLFLGKGFQETTVDEIAHGAGVSRRTVFRYFATKEEALLAWVDEVASDMSNVVASRPMGEPVFVTLRSALEVLVTFAEQDPDRIRRLKELTGPRGLFPAIQDRKQGSWSDKLTAALVGRDNATQVLDAALQIATAISAYDWAMARWLGAPDAARLSHLLDEAFAIIATGFDPGARPFTARPLRRNTKA